MLVCLAAQVFSEPNWKGMNTFHTVSDGECLADCMPTADLLLLVDQLFDSVNGPGRKDKPKDRRRDVTAESHHHAYWRVEIQNLQQWTFIRKDSFVRRIPHSARHWDDHPQAETPQPMNLKKYFSEAVEAAAGSPEKQKSILLRCYDGEEAEPVVSPSGKKMKSAKKIIVENWESIGWKPQLKKVLQDRLKSSQVSLAWLTCSEHNNLVSEKLMDLLLCNKINQEKKEKRVRVTRQVAKAIAKSTDEGLEDLSDS
ncbi:hypothetical protein FOCC_FOCC015561 [Frankliniella occidentalis]|nr:hypothetical protein FOCC_FOCC015561 [Frankliniella occidentalis]